MGRAWQATNISPQLLTGVYSIALKDLVWSIDYLLHLNSLLEAEYLFLGWQDLNNTMFDGFRPPAFGQGVLKWPKNQLVVDRLNAFVRYGEICLFFLYLGI